MIFLLSISILWVTAGAAVAESPQGIELSFLTRVYENLDSDLEPIQQGPLEIRLSSPEHRMEVFANHVLLDPLGEGRLGVTTTVEFGGEGQLEAQILAAGTVQQFSDSVVVPRQELTAQGVVTVERGESGYLFTVEERDASVPVTLESAMAQQLVALCSTLALLPVISVDCGGLERALTVIQVPLPEPGEQFFLPYEWLTDAERRYFESAVAP